MTTARPILMAAPMVRSTIEGIKTQTRRIANRPTDHFHASYVDAIKGDDGIWYWTDEKQTVRRPVPMRHGKPGDLLWVRESIWQASPYPGTDPSGEPDESGRWSSRLVHYAGDGEPPNCANRHYGPTGLHNGAFAAPDPYAVWLRRPAIHMPRWASRLTLELTDVRVERLQDISEEDAEAEGIARLPNGQWHWLGSSAAPGQHGYHTPTGAYDVLWGDINGLASWPSNPWVWVLAFKVHHANVDTVLAQRAEVAA